jgi:tetratricopeptide (TPR) repeat protein
VAEVRLRPLDPPDSERLVQLWPEPLSARPDRLVEQAAGRPLLMVESLRYLSTGGDPAALPPAAREWMQARLRALDDAAAQLAEAAAVLEKAATPEALARVAGLEAGAVEGAMDELLRRRILLAGDGWSFSHEMLRRAAYESLTAVRRRCLHARAAEELDVPENAAEVARHAEVAGELDVAWHKRLDAGSAAMELPAHRVAAEHFAAAIALRPLPSPAWLELGRAHELAGRADVAAGTYRALLDRARQAGEPALEAAALVRLGELEGRAFAEGLPDQLLEEAGEVAAEAGDQAMELEAVLAVAQVAAYRMDLGRAEIEGKA